MNINVLQHDVFNLLDTRLPLHFYYHNKEHTRYVMQASMQLAVAEKVCEPETALLLTAALLHDTGFTETIKDHEEKSCDIARQLLPAYEYDAATIDAVCELIMITKMPQQAHTLLDEILCDADLFYLGTNDFFIIGEKLFKEMSSLGQIESLDQWNELQVQFLSSHRYFTKTANRLLYEKKLANLFTLKARMRNY